jgi:hypothetical protein
VRDRDPVRRTHNFVCKASEQIPDLVEFGFFKTEVINYEYDCSGFRIWACAFDWIEIGSLAVKTVKINCKIVFRKSLDIILLFIGDSGLNKDKCA